MTRMAGMVSGLCLLSAGAMAQTRTYLIHFDGSCQGMRLHITQGLNVKGNTIGCGETKRAYVGKIEEGDVASVHNVNPEEDLVKLNYVISLRKQTWVLYETFDGKTEEIGNGYWTKKGPEVTVESVPGAPAAPGGTVNAEPETPK